MRLLVLSIYVLLFAVLVSGQAKPISEAEYKGLFSYAVSETNADFPFVFTVTTEFIENGKTVRTVVERDEREGQLRERITRTITTSNGVETQYQILTGFGNYFCSEDEKTWTASQYACFGPVMMYGRQQPLSVERTISEKTENGKTLKVLREVTILPPPNENGKKRFSEKVSTLDERGFFVSIIGTEGTLDPQTPMLTRKQIWTKEKFDPVSPPKID